MNADRRGSGKTRRKSPESHDIAVIARDRKSKSLPLMNADRRGSGKAKAKPTTEMRRIEDPVIGKAKAYR
jgi:hypothetical protein